VGKVTIDPEQFTLVLFESDVIITSATQIAAKVGIDADIHIEIDEPSALGRSRVKTVDPVVLWAQGGAFEDPKKPRHLSQRNLTEVLGRLLFRVKDRQDPGFAGAPEETELSLPQQTAWDAYCLGRLAGLGYDVAKPRRLYHFRNRHGFTDVADATFDRLWNASGLSWADIEAACAETEAAKAAV
jgi:hypothetical protein